MKKMISQHLTSISELLDFLGKEVVVYLQVHDFPDADAVASAFALPGWPSGNLCLLEE